MTFFILWFFAKKRVRSKRTPNPNRETNQLNGLTIEAIDP
jgi:hypothetical protein